MGSLNEITMEEVHRFPNDPVIVNGIMYWDTLRQFYEIKKGIVKAKKIGDIESIGIDTWGVDFGLLDEEFNAINNYMNNHRILYIVCFTYYIRHYKTNNSCK